MCERLGLYVREVRVVCVRGQGCVFETARVRIRLVGVRLELGLCV